MRKRSYQKYQALMLAFSAVAILALSGCNIVNKSVMGDTPDLNKSFSCEFSFSRNYDTSVKPLEAAGTITRYGSGIWEMNIAEPSTLSGMCITYNDESVKASLGDLNFETPKENINGNAVFKMIFSAVDNYAAQTNVSVSQSERGAEYSGNTDNFSYIMVFDKNSMELVGIDFPSYNMYVKIHGFNELKT